MMDKFTASNGWAVYVGTNGEIVVGEPSLVSDPSTDDRAALFLPSQVDALREFFLAERDAELGRWRWPEHPGYTVQRFSEAEVLVLFEPSGRSWVHDRLSAARTDFGVMTGVEAARAYFAAHPVRKPWEDAKPGEVWDVYIDGTQVDVTAVDAGDGNGVEFFARRVRCSTGYYGITAGRRIWPEVS